MKDSREQPRMGETPNYKVKLRGGTRHPTRDWESVRGTKREEREDGIRIRGIEYGRMRLGMLHEDSINICFTTSRIVEDAVCHNAKINTTTTTTTRRREKERGDI